MHACKLLTTVSRATRVLSCSIFRSAHPGVRPTEFYSDMRNVGLLHSFDNWYAGQISARLGLCVCPSVWANHHQATVPQMGCACCKAFLASVTIMTVSGVLQGGPRLMAIKADWRQEHHAYLAFSCPTEGTTSVLDIQGTHFQLIHLPGLDPNSPSLLLEALPGGWLVQVTPEVVAFCRVCSTPCLPC